MAEDVGQGEDEPRIFGDHVGGDEIDFGEGIRDGASVDGSAGVDAVKAVEELRGSFDLDSDQARASGNDEPVDPLCSLSFGSGWDCRRDVGRIEDQVVAFAFATGAGNSEVAAARAKASSEVSRERLVPSSSSKAVSVRAIAGMGRAWAGRGLRPEEAPLRLPMGWKRPRKSKRRKPEGLRQSLNLCVHVSQSEEQMRHDFGFVCRAQTMSCEKKVKLCSRQGFEVIGVGIPECVRIFAE